MEKKTINLRDVFTKETYADMENYLKTGNDGIAMMGYKSSRAFSASDITTRFQTLADPEYQADESLRANWGAMGKNYNLTQNQNAKPYIDGKKNSFALYDTGSYTDNVMFPLKGAHLNSAVAYMSGVETPVNYDEIKKLFEKGFNVPIKEVDSPRMLEYKEGVIYHAGKAVARKAKRVQRTIKKALGMDVVTINPDLTIKKHKFFKQPKINISNGKRSSGIASITDADKLVALVDHFVGKSIFSYDHQLVGFSGFSKTPDEMKAKTAARLLADIFVCQALDMGGDGEANRRIDNALKLQYSNVVAGLDDFTKADFDIVAKNAHDATANILNHLGVPVQNIAYNRVKYLGQQYKDSQLGESQQITQNADEYDILFGATTDNKFQYKMDIQEIKEGEYMMQSNVHYTGPSDFFARYSQPAQPDPTMPPLDAIDVEQDDHKEDETLTFEMDDIGAPSIDFIPEDNPYDDGQSTEVDAESNANGGYYKFRGDAVEPEDTEPEPVEIAPTPEVDPISDPLQTAPTPEVDPVLDAESEVVPISEPSAADCSSCDLRAIIDAFEMRLEAYERANAQAAHYISGLISYIEDLTQTNRSLVAEIESKETPEEMLAYVYAMGVAFGNAHPKEEEKKAAEKLQAFQINDGKILFAKNENEYEQVKEGEEYDPTRPLDEQNDFKKYYEYYKNILTAPKPQATETQQNQTPNEPQEIQAVPVTENNEVVDILKDILEELRKLNAQQELVEADEIERIKGVVPQIPQATTLVALEEQSSEVETSRRSILVEGAETTEKRIQKAEKKKYYDDLTTTPKFNARKILIDWKNAMRPDAAITLAVYHAEQPSIVAEAEVKDNEADEIIEKLTLQSVAKLTKKFSREPIVNPSEPEVKTEKQTTLQKAILPDEKIENIFESLDKTTEEFEDVYQKMLGFSLLEKTIKEEQEKQKNAAQTTLAEFEKPQPYSAMTSGQNLLSTLQSIEDENQKEEQEARIADQTAAQFKFLESLVDLSQTTLDDFEDEKNISLAESVQELAEDMGANVIGDASKIRAITVIKNPNVRTRSAFDKILSKRIAVIVNDIDSIDLRRKIKRIDSELARAYKKKDAEMIARLEGERKNPQYGVKQYLNKFVNSPNFKSKDAKNREDAITASIILEKIIALKTEILDSIFGSQKQIEVENTTNVKLLNQKLGENYGEEYADCYDKTHSFNYKKFLKEKIEEFFEDVKKLQSDETRGDAGAAEQADTKYRTCIMLPSEALKQEGLQILQLEDEKEEKQVSEENEEFVAEEFSQVATQMTPITSVVGVTQIKDVDFSQKFDGADLGKVAREKNKEDVAQTVAKDYVGFTGNKFAYLNKKMVQELKYAHYMRQTGRTGNVAGYKLSNHTSGNKHIHNSTNQDLGQTK